MMRHRAACARETPWITTAARTTRPRSAPRSARQTASRSASRTTSQRKNAEEARPIPRRPIRRARGCEEGLSIWEPVEGELRITVGNREIGPDLRALAVDQQPHRVARSRDAEVAGLLEQEPLVAPLVRVVLHRVGDVAGWCVAKID